MIQICDYIRWERTAPSLRSLAHTWLHMVVRTKIIELCDVTSVPISLVWTFCKKNEEM